MRSAPARRSCRRLAAVAALLLPLVVPASPAGAQERNQVTGTVVDSAGRGVTNAMVVALSRPDSVLVTYALSSGEGRFTLRDLVAGDYILQVTSMGFATVRRDFTVEDGDVDAGTIRMRVVAMEMDPLVVSAEQVPFVNRRDTLDYNAAAFQLRPNASVEELLARLPGIQVEDDGTIVAQGEEVTRVLVDGKEFFGGSPTVATRNLPADAVERVQVFDRRSDMAEFTGIEDGEEERAVNLQLKEEARRGAFGSVAGGLGGEDGGAPPVGPETDAQLRHQLSFNIARFTPTWQLALLGGANDVNQPAASMGGGGGRRGGGGAGGEGSNEALAVGTNLSFDPGEDRWVRGSYFYNGRSSTRDRLVQRQQLVGVEVTQELEQLTASESENRNHRLNLNAQYRISEGHDVRVRASAAMSSGEEIRSQDQVTVDPDGTVINDATTLLDSESDDVSGNVRLTWRKRLSESGRSLVLSARGVLNDRDASSELDGRIDVPGRGGPAPGDALTSDELRQIQQQDTRGYTESQRLALTQPLGGSRVLELYAERRTVGEDQSQSVFDLRSGAPVLDDALSSELDQRYGYLTGGLRLSRNTERTFLTLGAELQRSSLDGRTPEVEEPIRRDFHFLLPSANFRYEIRDGWTLNARYAASAREPDARELQPFVDNTDPLSIYVGNPELQPETRHTLQLEQRWFDPFTFRNVFAYARFAFQQDAIQQARVIDERGVQTVTPVNTDGGWSLRSGVDLSTPIRRIGVEVDAGYDLTLSREQQLLDLQDNETTIVRNGVSLSVENRRKSTFDVEAGARFTFNDVRYSLSEGQDQSYMNISLRADGEWYPTEQWTVASSVTQQLFDEEVFGPGQDVTLWQASLSRLLLDGRGELELTAFDLLDQNQGVDFVNAANFVQESRTNTLGRHVMLRFVWRIGRVPRGGPGGMGRR